MRTKRTHTREPNTVMAIIHSVCTINFRNNDEYISVFYIIWNRSILRLEDELADIWKQILFYCFDYEYYQLSNFHIHLVTASYYILAQASKHPMQLVLGLPIRSCELGLMCSSLAHVKDFELAIGPTYSFSQCASLAHTLPRALGSLKLC